MKNDGNHGGSVRGKKRRAFARSPKILRRSEKRRKKLEGSHGELEEREEGEREEGVAGLGEKELPGRNSSEERALNESYEDESGGGRRGRRRGALNEKEWRMKRRESELPSSQAYPLTSDTMAVPPPVDLGQIILLFVRVHGIARER